MSYTVTLLEYCLVTGVDWWDVLLGLRPGTLMFEKLIVVVLCLMLSSPILLNKFLGMIESICDKMTDVFSRQPPARQQVFLNRFLSIKMTMYR